MADECDLEELTAFLDASDVDEETQPGEMDVGNTDIPTHVDSDAKSEIVPPEKTEDLSQDEIEAFLQASDDSDSDDEKDTKTEEQDDVETKEKVSVVSKEKVDVNTKEKVDVNAKEKVDVNAKEKVDVNAKEKVDVNAKEKDDIDTKEKVDVDTNAYNTDKTQDVNNEDAEFDDFDETDMEQLEQILDNSGDQSTIDKDEDQYNGGNQSKTGMHEIEESVEVDNEEENQVTNVDADSIKAEMAAMAERMKQLEQMLNQSQSNSNKSPSCSNKSPSSSNKPPSSSNKSPSSSNKSSSSSNKSTSSSNKSTSSSNKSQSSISQSDPRGSYQSTSSSSKSDSRDSHHRSHKQADKNDSCSSPSERKHSHRSPSDSKVSSNHSKEKDKKPGQDSYSDKLARAMSAHKHKKHDSKSSLRGERDSKSSTRGESDNKSSKSSPRGERDSKSSTRGESDSKSSTGSDRDSKSSPRGERESKSSTCGESKSTPHRKRDKSSASGEINSKSTPHREHSKSTPHREPSKSTPHREPSKSTPHREHRPSERKQEDSKRTKLKTESKTDTEEENPFFASNKQEASQTPLQTTSSDKKLEAEITSKSIFGDDSDSDWDELGGEEKHELSKEGKEINRIITSGHRKREAHTPSYDTNVLKKPNLSSWSEKPHPQITLHPVSGHTGLGRLSVPPSAAPDKPTLNPETGTVSGKYKLRDEYMQKSTVAKEDERESVTDPFCGIRIINPRISMSEFKLKMDGRTMLRIPKLLSTGNKLSELQKDNWVTVGVVVHKTEPRQSAAGKAYCIWKLSDLQDCDKTVTFFLFGNIYKEHWKNDLGVVVGLLNPSMMEKAEKNQSELAMTIQHPQQLLMLGISKDLGRCRSTTKSGNPCSSVINKQQGEFCTYHVQSAYRKSSSKRTELQASTGVTPKNFAAGRTLNNNKKDGFYFYGGQTFTTMRPQAKSSKDTMTLKKLQNFEAGKPAGKITTMSLHELEADDQKKINKLAEKDKQLLSLLSVPSAGSMNFVKHLVKKDATKSFVNKGDSDEETAAAASARDLLKEHAKIIVQKKRETALLSAKPTIGKGFTCGQQISLDVPVKKKAGNASAEFAKQLAIAKVKAKGGLKTEDPNAVRKKVVSPEAREKIKKRVAEAMDAEPSSSKEADTSQPPKKKSKLLGDLDLNSPEIQQLLKKKSKHTGALAEAEAEHEDRYFSALEKKEKMEDKMSSIKEVSVKLVYCVQCKYRYFSAHERCKKENHTLKYMNGVKRFFRCKQCKKRTVCLDKFPTTACQQCGNNNYERVSMHKEKSGPKLESEELCLRGNEQKFIGSLQGKASFNG